jgi:hypothetical protein
MLRLTSGSIGSRFGGFQSGARSLLRRADGVLGKELKTVRASEIALSSFTFGVVQGRFASKGGLTAFGIPVDLLAGAGFHILGLFGFAKPYAHHLHAIGDGAIASFFTTTGYKVGARWEQTGSIMKGMSGMLGEAKAAPSGGATLADKELASLVRAE